MITAPSGQVFSESDLDLARGMVTTGFIRRSTEPFTLKSRVKSFVYVFGREDVTDNPAFEWWLGEKLAEIVREHHRPAWARGVSAAPCLIGVPTAGGVLAQAATMAGWRHSGGWGYTISHRVMREAKKQHGAHQTWVNGKPNPERHSYWMVDNVATDGQSKIEAAAKLAEDGYPAKQMPCLILVDRQQGAVKRLEREGFEKVVVVYKLLDLAYVFGELGLWPKDMVKKVEEEIAAHQLVS